MTEPKEKNPGKGGANPSARGNSSNPTPSRSELEKKVEEILREITYSFIEHKDGSKELVYEGIPPQEAQKKLTTLIQDSIRESLERVKVSVEKRVKGKGEQHELWFDEGLYTAYELIQEELDRLKGE